MPEMKTLNGYEIVDAKAREDIVALQEAVDNIEIPEGGGGSGKTLVELYSTTEKASMNHDLLKEVYDYAAAGNNVFDKYDFVYRPGPLNTQVARVLSITCKYNRITALMYNPLINSTEEMYEYTYNISSKTPGISAFTMLNASNYSNYISVSSEGGDWTTTRDPWDSNIYNAKEIYISITDDTGDRLFSYLVLPEGLTLGDGFVYTEFPLVTYSDSTDMFWYYTGYGIECYTKSDRTGQSLNIDTLIIAYKA